MIPTLALPPTLTVPLTLKVRYLTDSPRTLIALVPGLKMENGGKINVNGYA